MPAKTLTVFDPNITINSPIGSCLLKMLEAAATSYELRIITHKTGLEPAPHITIHKLRIPQRPVLLQNILFTLQAIFYRRGGVSVSSQGCVPFCDISYCQNPHKLLLTRYRHLIGGDFLTRTARILNFRWIAMLESIAFKRARLIVVPSQGCADELVESYGASIASKLRVNPNPVDCAAFAPPADIQLPTTFTFAFCALGNFEWKGLGLIIQALATGIPAHVKVIGGTPSEIRTFQTLAQESNVAEQVLFLGMQTDVRPHLWTSHAFVFPSLHESFGLVCLQAAAAGLPLITTDLYALSDLLQPGISGWRIERNVAALAEAMRLALANPEQTRQMGRNAQQLAQKYDEPAFQQRWLDLLSCLSGVALKTG